MKKTASLAYVLEKSTVSMDSGVDFPDTSAVFAGPRSLSLVSAVFGGPVILSSCDRK